MADDILVCETHDKTVFRCPIFVFVLGDETLTSIVVCLSLTAAFVLDLKPLVVRLVLHLFYESHGVAVARMLANFPDTDLTLG